MSLTDIQSRIAIEERRANRPQGATKLIAVSKVQPLKRVTSVLDQGHRMFGENKVQEAAGKWPALRDTYENIDLHLLGPLQSNKTRQAMQLFDTIHSVDRLKLAKALARLAQELGRCPQLFLQINTGAEPQKAGVLPDDADTFIAACRALDLPVVGLMCIPPADQDPAVHFSQLAELAKRNDITGLSMGMSSDFEQAIAQGATHIRIGSAIFGQRVQPVVAAT